MRARALPTPDEIRSLRAVVEYGTVRRAAVALHVSYHTVDAHLDKLRRKTGRRYMHQLVAWAAENRWFEEPALPEKTPDSA